MDIFEYFGAVLFRHEKVSSFGAGPKSDFRASTGFAYTGEMSDYMIIFDLFWRSFLS